MVTKNKINILALSGSLRRLSYNTAMLEAISELAPEHVEVNVYKKLGELALFNPDLNENEVSSFLHLTKCLANADGLIIACPEYAHGITGVLKNALDWLVAGEEFVDIPIALLNASPRASHAQASLKEVVTTMSGNVIEKACVSVPLLGSSLDVNGIVRNEQISDVLVSALDMLCQAIANDQEKTKD